MNFVLLLSFGLFSEYVYISGKCLVSMKSWFVAIVLASLCLPFGHPPGKKSVAACELIFFNFFLSCGSFLLHCIPFFSSSLFWLLQIYNPEYPLSPYHPCFACIFLSSFHWLALGMYFVSSSPWSCCSLSSFLSGQGLACMAVPKHASVLGFVVRSQCCHRPCFVTAPSGPWVEAKMFW